MIKPLILSLWIVILSTGATAQAPSICFKNTSDSITIEVEIPQLHLSITIPPRKTSIMYLFTEMLRSPEYVIRHDRKAFASAADITGGVITSGTWTMHFLYNKKGGVWRSVMRQYDSDLDK